MTQSFAGGELPKNPGAGPQSENAGETPANLPTPPADEGLPEWEPLTAELVEDEAIRGDFVMRWAVVGLALLLGCSQIAETKSLVHLRSGEYLATHGLLPPATDYLAYTRENQPWINLSWLFDLVAAGVHGLGGGIGLSFFQALLAAVTFLLLVHTVRPEIRTWWGSICAAFALLACFRQFTIQPELITLLGTAVTLWLLMRTSESSKSGRAWSLIPVIWIWSQLDSRAFVGWGLLLLFGLGELVGTLGGRPGFRNSSQRKQYWIICGAAILIAAVHPFLWQAWLSPWRVYGLEYPAWRAAYPDAGLADRPFQSIVNVNYWFNPDHGDDLRYWHGLTISNLAAVYLMLAAVVTMLLNRRRTPIAHVTLFLGANGLTLFAGHELAVASLVNCVLATLNAQDWYASTFGQTYSTQWNVLLFSRGGRAVTVLGLSVIGFLAISGRIDGPNGKRTGIGFDEELASQMTSYEQAAADSFDDRPFPFVVRQGDMLIWAGQKSFIDSRLELFHGGSSPDLIELHSTTRAAMRRKQPELIGSGEPAVWRKVFADYQITHAVVRLSGLLLPPNYKTFNDLSGLPYWKLTRLTSSAAVFYRTDLKRDQELRAYIDQHKLDAPQLAFQTDNSPETIPQDWPTVSSAYQQFLSVPQTTTTGRIAEANHFLHYASQERLQMSHRLGAAYLALRDARAALRDNPHHAGGYRALGAAYSLLDKLERFELQRNGSETSDNLRYFLAAFAWQAALLLEPGHPLPHQELADLYLRMQRWDLASRHLNELLRIQQRFDPNADSTQFQKMAAELDQRVTAINSQIDSQLAQGANPLQLALAAEQNGAVLTAIRMAGSDKATMARDPRLQIAYCMWLLEAGRAQEASDMLRYLEQMPGIDQVPRWQEVAAAAAWAQGDYQHVIELYERAINLAERRRIEGLLLSGPFSASSSRMLVSDRYPWVHTIAADDALGRRQLEVGGWLLGQTLCRLEQGDMDAAAQSLERAFDQVAENPFRPLMILYWYCLKNERLDLEPPAEWIPIYPGLFAEEPAG